MSRSQGSHRAVRGARRSRAEDARGFSGFNRPYEPGEAPGHGRLYEPGDTQGFNRPYEPGRVPRQYPLAAPPPVPPGGPRTAATVRPAAAPAPPVPAPPVAAPPPPAAAPAPPGGGRAAVRRAAQHRRAAERPDALRRLVPQALVVAFLAGGTSAFVAHDKSVRLTVDGTDRTLHTFADDVQELLEDEGVEVGRHDLVSPAPEEALADGDEVVVRYGRPVTLTLDGTDRRVWTTAGTVESALHQLGVRAEGADLSASRSSSISRRGLDLNVWTERTVTVLADGRVHAMRTNAATVREVVEQAGIVLRGQDTTSVAQDSFPYDGQTVSVLRITGTEEVREEPVRFRTVSYLDASLTQGTEVVVQQGLQGARRVTYALRTVNGVRQKPRKLRSEVVRRPRTQVVHVGTKPLPRSVSGADGLNWSAMAHCESGGRTNAVDASGTYGGLYQFDTPTWQRLGGRGRPQDAPAGEQTYRAKKLYVQRGASPWPHCGRKLHQ
ncbi:ubiquitin-like domain-containing protein [Streptomyces sp. NPDC048639]|uniref:ubiquitin-like domain-containing protein n=1 Tax=Streptomyces sp. NPDC048639 TaxID=3365581 RepID=UPI003710126C